MDSGNRYARATVAMMAERMEWAWSMKKRARWMALFAAAAFVGVLGIRMAMAARAVTVNGGRRVIRTGSHVGSGRERDRVRDHERLG